MLPERHWYEKKLTIIRTVMVKDGFLFLNLTG
jgi:hypothetical protein